VNEVLSQKIRSLQRRVARAKMVGFRNLAVHQYQELDLDLVESVIRVGLDDLLAFAEAVRGMAPGGRPS